MCVTCSCMLLAVCKCRSCWKRLDRSGRVAWWSSCTASSAWTLSRSRSPFWEPYCPTYSQTPPTGTAWQTHRARPSPSKRDFLPCLCRCWCDSSVTYLSWWFLRLSVWCALSSYSSHHKGPFSARQRKRQREDIEVKHTRTLYVPTKAAYLKLLIIRKHWYWVQKSVI